MNSMFSKIWPFVVLVIVVLIACYVWIAFYEDRPEKDAWKAGDGSRLVLRSYEIPEEYGEEAMRLIRDVMVLSDQQKLGTAKLAPNGKLLVAAPERFHEGIKELIGNLQKSKPEPPPTVKIQYWIFLGLEADEPGSVEKFGGVAGALDTINESQGPHKFALLERLSTTSLSDRPLRIGGTFVSIGNTATVYDERVMMELSVTFNVMGNRFETNVQVPLGKTLVLGESTYKISRTWSTLVDALEGEKEFQEQLEKNFNIFSVYYLIKADILE